MRRSDRTTIQRKNEITANFKKILNELKSCQSPEKP